MAWVTGEFCTFDFSIYFEMWWNLSLHELNPLMVAIEVAYALVKSSITVELKYHPVNVC